MWRPITLAAAALFFAATAHAAGVPMELDAFTTYAFGRLKQIKPDANARITGQGAIDIKGVGTVYVDRIYAFCQKNKADCDEKLTDFLTNVLTIRPNAAFDVASLRAALRPTSYVDGMKAQFGDKPEAKILSRPFAGDLSEICMLDSPKSARMVMMTDLSDGHLTPEAAFKLCENNLVKAVPFPDMSGIASGRAAPLAGGFYQSSLPLLHDAWAPVVKRFGGKLLIAVPESNVMLVANGDDPALARALAKAAAIGAQSADRPLSVQVFRWTPAGWEAVMPDSL